RGAIVVTAALVKALKEKWIGSAGIDVVDPEPIGADHPLNSLSNCVILPHVGSGENLHLSGAVFSVADPVRVFVLPCGVGR
ncbi:MAG: hypothetical protein BJ554DRAFT_2664, partial [Olpidium bornovanus]